MYMASMVPIYCNVYCSVKCIAYLVISNDAAQFQCKHSILICLLQLPHSSSACTCADFIATYYNSCAILYWCMATVTN